MQNSFTPINTGHAGPSNLTLRARPTQRPSYLDDQHLEYFKSLEDSGKSPVEGGERWDEEEEVIFWEACKMYKYKDNRQEAGPKVLAEMESRGKRYRNIPTFSSKLWRMEEELEECQQIIKLQSEMWWDENAHLLRARDREVQAKFLKTYPRLKKYFVKSRKWATADLIRAPSNIVGNPQRDNYDNNFVNTPPPASGSRKRGRPRKLKQSKGKGPELPALERPRKRTREASPSASYQPTNRSSLTLSEPFPSISRSHSPLMPRHTPQIDPMEILQDLAKQGLNAQSAIPPNQANEASGSQASNAVHNPPRSTVENAPPDDEAGVQQQPSASPAANNASRPPSSMPGNAPPPEQQQEQVPPPEIEAPPSAHRPRSLAMEQNASQRQQQERVPRPEREAPPSAPRPRSLASEQNESQRQQQGRVPRPDREAPPSAPRPRSLASEQNESQRQQQERAIKQEGSGTRESPVRVLDDGPAESSSTAQAQFSSAAVHVEDPCAETVDIIMAQIGADIKRLPELTQEGHAAMHTCFGNEEQGKFYIRTAKYSSVEMHLIYVRNQLSWHYEKRKKNPAALFKR